MRSGAVALQTVFSKGAQVSVPEECVIDFEVKLFGGVLGPALHLRLEGWSCFPFLLSVGCLGCFTSPVAGERPFTFDV